MTAGLLEGDFDPFADVIEPDKVESQSGPLTGSRGGSAPATSRTGRRPRRTATNKRLDAVQVKLSQEMFSIGGVLGMGVPVTGYYICQESDSFTKAVVQLASKRPEWIEALEHIADIQPGITAGRTLLGIGAALAVDRKRVDPDKQFLKFLGVYSAYRAIQDNKSPGTIEEGNAYVPPPAGSFKPVS